MNINPAELRIGQTVKVLAPVAQGKALLQGSIVSIDSNMIRVQCKQSEKRSEVFNVKPESIVEVLA